MDDSLRRKLAGAGAALFAIGMLTGFWTALAMGDVVKVAIPRLSIATHLNALLGGLWLIALALTLDLLHYGPVGRRRLALLAAFPAWANWLITLVASLLGVRGLRYTGELRNDAIAALLQALVVAPTIAAVFVWVWGFRARKA
ncbi:MAG TPA: hypothetical protein VKN99_11510 [Polyangia bacterium]|nr:hypothetical protein [Polyangia bacterium]